MCFPMKSFLSFFILIMFATWENELLKKTFSLRNRRPTRFQRPLRSVSGSGSFLPPTPPPPRSAAAQARRQRYQHRRRQLRRLGGFQADAGITTTTDSVSVSVTTTTDPSNAAGEGEARSSVEGRCWCWINLAPLPPRRKLRKKPMTRPQMRPLSPLKRICQLEKNRLNFLFFFSCFFLKKISKKSKHTKCLLEVWLLFPFSKWIYLWLTDDNRIFRFSFSIPSLPFLMAATSILMITRSLLWNGTQ